MLGVCPRVNTIEVLLFLCPPFHSCPLCQNTQAAPKQGTSRLLNMNQVHVLCTCALVPLVIRCHLDSYKRLPTDAYTTPVWASPVFFTKQPAESSKRMWDHTTPLFTGTPKTPPFKVAEMMPAVRLLPSRFSLPRFLLLPGHTGRSLQRCHLRLNTIPLMPFSHCLNQPFSQLKLLHPGEVASLRMQRTFLDLLSVAPQHLMFPPPKHLGQSMRTVFSL